MRDNLNRRALAYQIGRMASHTRVGVAENKFYGFRNDQEKAPECLNFIGHSGKIIFRCARGIAHAAGRDRQEFTFLWSNNRSYFRMQLFDVATIKRHPRHGSFQPSCQSFDQMALAFTICDCVGRAKIFAAIR